MKKIFLFLLVTIFTFALASCQNIFGNKGNKEEDKTTEVETEIETEETTEEVKGELTQGFVADLTGSLAEQLGDKLYLYQKDDNLVLVSDKGDSLKLNLTEANQIITDIQTQFNEIQNGLNNLTLDDVLNAIVAKLNKTETPVTFKELVEKINLTEADFDVKGDVYSLKQTSLARIVNTIILTLTGVDSSLQINAIVGGIQNYVCDFTIVNGMLQKAVLKGDVQANHVDLTLTITETGFNLVGDFNIWAETKSSDFDMDSFEYIYNYGYIGGIVDVTLTDNGFSGDVTLKETDNIVQGSTVGELTTLQELKFTFVFPLDTLRCVVRGTYTSATANNEFEVVLQLGGEGFNLTFSFIDNKTEEAINGKFNCDLYDGIYLNGSVNVNGVKYTILLSALPNDNGMDFQLAIKADQELVIDLNVTIISNETGFELQVTLETAQEKCFLDIYAPFDDKNPSGLGEIVVHLSYNEEVVLEASIVAGEIIVPEYDDTKTVDVIDQLEQLINSNFQ